MPPKQQQEQREFVTFRLGMMRDSAKDAIASQDDFIRKAPREEDDVSFYVYLGGHLLDLTTLSDNSHAIKLPIGSTTNRSDKITLKIGTTNRLKRMTYATCNTTVGDLQDATADGKMHSSWIKLDDRNTENVVPLKRANKDSDKVMSVLVYRGTDAMAEAQFFKVRHNVNKVSPRWNYYTHKATTFYQTNYIEHHDGCHFCDSFDTNRVVGKGIQSAAVWLSSGEHFYNSIAAYFRVDKDILYKMGLVQDMQSHSEWRRLLSLLRAWSKKFEIGCDEHAITWRDHRIEVYKKIKDAEYKLNQCQDYKEQIVQMYRATQGTVKDTNQDCIQFTHKVTKEADIRISEKNKLSSVEDDCRMTIHKRVKIQSKEAYTVACNEGEAGLQNGRHAICIDLLNQAIVDCADQVKFLKDRNLTLQNNKKAINSATKEQNELTKQAPGLYKDIQEELEQNNQDHQVGTQENQKELNAIMNECQRTHSQFEQKRDELDHLTENMQSLQDEEERLRRQSDDLLKNTKDKILSLKKQANDSIDMIHKTGGEAARCKAEHTNMKDEIKILQLNRDHYSLKDADLAGRKQRLEEDIRSIMDAIKDLDAETRSVKEDWLEYYQQTYHDLSRQCEMNDNAWINEQIENTKRQTVQANDQAILKEIKELQQTLSTLPADSLTDRELETVIADARRRLVEMRIKMNEKIVCYDDIVCQSKILIAVNQQCCENQNEMMMLEAEIDASIVEVVRKEQLVKEQQFELDQYEDEYKHLESEIEDQDERLFRLRDDITNQDATIDSNELRLGQMESQIAYLEEMTGKKAKYGAGDQAIEMQVHSISAKAGAPRKKVYKAVRGDIVDELLAKIINETDCTLPIRKLGKGKYMFGTKKVSMQAKVNSLLVRVGGGYSDFREFLINYGDQEADKIAVAKSKGEWNEEELYQLYLGEVNPHLQQQRGTIAPGRASQSSRASIGQGASGVSMSSASGSPRASQGRKSRTTQ